ncbi:AMP-binding protein [Puerhibacterium puerhi]|uniref:AMP-binding protein n=1 Tax=Puerhibacterium puerhi TaxID=2692623 RepID=UPI001356A1C4|nr:AMP-binding protein [Puerhibacterium puerhi]
MTTSTTPPWLELDSRAEDGSVAVRRRDKRQPDVTWRLLACRTRQLAGVLHHAGVRRGHRVAVMTGPGPMRTATLYAVWRLGGIVVAASDTLSRRERLTAIASARPVAVIGDRRSLAGTRQLASVHLRLATEPLSPLDMLTTGTRLHVAALVARRPHVILPSPPAPDDDAALLFPRPGGAADPVGVFYTQAELADVYARIHPDASPRPRTGAPGAPGLVARSSRAGAAGLAAALVTPGFPAAELHLPAHLLVADEAPACRSCASPGVRRVPQTA